MNSFVKLSVCAPLFHSGCGQDVYNSSAVKEIEAAPGTCSLDASSTDVGAFAYSGEEEGQHAGVSVTILDDKVSFGNIDALAMSVGSVHTIEQNGEHYKSIEGENTGDWLGWSLGKVGDLDGDAIE